MNTSDLLDAVIARNGNSLHLRVGEAPIMAKGSDTVHLPGCGLDNREVGQLIREVAPPQELQRLDARAGEKPGEPVRFTFAMPHRAIIVVGNVVQRGDRRALDLFLTPRAVVEMGLGV